MLLANSHDENGFSVPPTVTEAINDRSVEATVKSPSPCLDLLFQEKGSLEADASQLSSVFGLYSGFCIELRGETVAFPSGTLSFLSGCMVSRIFSYSHPSMVVALFLDPSFVPCRQRVCTGLSGAESLSTLRGRAVRFLCGGEEWGGGCLGAGRYEGAGGVSPLCGRGDAGAALPPSQRVVRAQRPVANPPVCGRPYPEPAMLFSRVGEGIYATGTPAVKDSEQNDGRAS